MLGSDAPFSSWANHPFEIQNLLSPFTSAILRLACSTSRTVMFRLLRRLLSFSPAGTVILANRSRVLTHLGRLTIFDSCVEAGRRVQDPGGIEAAASSNSRLQDCSFKVRAKFTD